MRSGPAPRVYPTPAELKDMHVFSTYAKKKRVVAGSISQISETSKKHSRGMMLKAPPAGARAIPTPKPVRGGCGGDHPPASGARQARSIFMVAPFAPKKRNLNILPLLLLPPFLPPRLRRVTLRALWSFSLPFSLNVRLVESIEVARKLLMPFGNLFHGFFHNSPHR